jgi:hypothetical protein
VGISSLRLASMLSHHTTSMYMHTYLSLQRQYWI